MDETNIELLPDTKEATDNDNEKVGAYWQLSETSNCTNIPRNKIYREKGIAEDLDAL